MGSELTLDGIGKTTARLARHVDVALSDVELSTPQYRMLLQLSEGKEASTSLAKKLAVTAPSVTAVVEGLVQRGFVERRHSDEDRRRISLELTDLGRRTLEEADAAVAGKLRAIAEQLCDRSATEAALDSLRSWGEALDAYRLVRAAEVTALAGGGRSA